MSAVFGDIQATPVLLASATVLISVLLYWHFTKLRRHGIRGPTPIPFFGNILQLQSMGPATYDKLYQDKYGKVYGYYLGYRPVVAVADPNILKSVLVKDFANFVDRTNVGNVPALLQNGLFFMGGRTWKRTRNILTPTFSAGKLKHLVGIMNNCATVLAGNMDARVGEAVDVKEVFGQFSIDTIAAMAFGLDINSQEQPDEPFVKNIRRFFTFTGIVKVYFMISTMIPKIGSLMYKMGLSAWNKESVDFFEKTGKALIEDRKMNTTNRYDFMKLLIEAEFDDTNNEYVHSHGTTVDTLAKKDSRNVIRLNEDEINGQVFVFFLAGYETLASTLRFAAYVLALHPDIDEKVVEEMNEKLGQDTPTYENVGKLTYMEQFINEVLRFYPPVPRLNRVTIDDYKIDNEMTIPKGTVIHIPTWSIHHNPEFYTDPETFDPNRFSPENKGSFDTYTFLPFGLGPRHCIGMRLAYVEAKVALVHILRKVRFVRCEKTQVPLELGMTGILKPHQPVLVQVEAR